MKPKAILLCVVVLCVTAILIFTGCKNSTGGGEPASPYATWTISSMSLTTPGGPWTATNVSMTFDKNGTWFESFTGADSNPYWMAGTFTPTNLPSDTVISTPITGNSRGNSISGDQYGGGGVGPSGSFKYSKLTDTTVDIYEDVSGTGNFQGPFTFQLNPAGVSQPDFIGTWKGATQPKGTVTITLTATTFSFVADNGNGTVETVSGTFAYDASLKHMLLTVEQESYTGSPPGSPFAKGDRLYILYSLSGSTLTSAMSEAGYPPDLSTGIAMAKQ